MASGPSKEELQNYWNTSRQYFDELARHYKTADPQYYNEYIAPFYSNPLYVVSSARKGSAGVRAVLLSIFVFIAVAVAGVVVFLVSVKESEDKGTKNIERKIESTEENRLQKDTKSPGIDKKSGFPSDDFILGSKYLAEKDYDKAEEHFKKIKPGDENYEQAQQLLESMEYLRKYEK
jgi:hypothetical protein